jgi:carbon storage regulator
MLVLTRKPGESIIIGDAIRLTVVSVGPGRVKIGIEAPPAVRVDRQEIHELRHEPAPDEAVVVEHSPLHNRIASLGRPPFPPRKPR